MSEQLRVVWPEEIDMISSYNAKKLNTNQRQLLELQKRLQGRFLGEFHAREHQASITFDASLSEFCCVVCQEDGTPVHHIRIITDGEPEHRVEKSMATEIQIWLDQHPRTLHMKKSRMRIRSLLPELLPQ